MINMVQLNVKTFNHCSKYRKSTWTSNPFGWYGTVHCSGKGWSVAKKHVTKNCGNKTSSMIAYAHEPKQVDILCVTCKMNLLANGKELAGCVNQNLTNQD